MPDAKAFSVKIAYKVPETAFMTVVAFDKETVLAASKSILESQAKNLEDAEILSVEEVPSQTDDSPVQVSLQ